MRLSAFILVTGITAQIAPAGAEENLWGAIALGGNGFGASRGRPDENAAISGALRQCEESGGAGECKIRLTYRNRCAAYASGDNREVAIAYADTMEKASKLAQRSCSEATKLPYPVCGLQRSLLLQLTSYWQPNADRRHNPDNLQAGRMMDGSNLED